jgi:hypothetical protein
MAARIAVKSFLTSLLFSHQLAGSVKEPVELAASGYTTVLCAITVLYHSAVSLGVRVKVAKST